MPYDDKKKRYVCDRCGSDCVRTPSGWSCWNNFICGAKVVTGFLHEAPIEICGSSLLPDDDEEGEEDCDECHGTGEVDCDDCDGSGEEECYHCGQLMPCETCDGGGCYDCEKCGGEGVIQTIAKGT